MFAVEVSCLRTDFCGSAGGACQKWPLGWARRMMASSSGVRPQKGERKTAMSGMFWSGLSRIFRSARRSWISGRSKKLSAGICTGIS